VLIPSTLNVLKAEAYGQLNLDPNMMSRLGLEGLTPLQCKVATALWMSKPVVPNEAALHVLRIPIISKSKKVVSINTAPPWVRSKRLGRGGIVCLAPVDLYTSRPSTPELNQMTLIMCVSNTLNPKPYT
jgi:hypothetical protein